MFNWIKNHKLQQIRNMVNQSFFLMKNFKLPYFWQYYISYLEGGEHFSVVLFWSNLVLIKELGFLWYSPTLIPFETMFQSLVLKAYLNRVRKVKRQAK